MHGTHLFAAVASLNDDLIYSTRVVDKTAFFETVTSALITRLEVWQQLSAVPWRCPFAEFPFGFAVPPLRHLSLNYSGRDYQVFSVLGEPPMSPFQSQLFGVGLPIVAVLPSPRLGDVQAFKVMPTIGFWES